MYNANANVLSSSSEERRRRAEVNYNMDVEGE